MEEKSCQIHEENRRSLWKGNEQREIYISIYIYMYMYVYISNIISNNEKF
ncbi:rCG53405 [Rattus norvegicus]|uniref:RCG53405 n=1 Tax=Rattus norvegicus TaxID=10116 RepID=A6JRQ7_RAT|nr:rCG53405 [Rattus norvegicus]